MKLTARLVLISVVFLALLGIQSAKAGRPPTQRGKCGAPIPRGARDLGGGRYDTGRTWKGQVKFYKRVFGRYNPKYKFILLFNIPRAKVMHIASFNRRTRWAGINVSAYGSRRRTKIFVICR